LISNELKDVMRTIARPVLLAFFAAVGLGMAQATPQVIEQVLVKVNGDIITKTDLEQRQVQTLRAKGIQPTDEAALKKAVEEVTPQIVGDYIDELLLVQRGHELGYKLTDEDFDRVVSNIRKENKLETDEAFQAALKQEGLTMEELRKSLERQMLMTRVTQNEVMAKVGVTEEEARKYHAEHKAEFTKPATITLREMLVKVPAAAAGVNVAADEAAKAKAEDARKRLLAGEDFEKVAAEFSDSPSKVNGGVIGPINVNELTPAFKQVLDPMKVGDVSEVIRGQNGYEILKLESRTAEEVQAPEEVHDQIADAIWQQKREVEIKKYLAKLRSQATIEWKNEEIHKAWDAWMAQQPAVPTDPLEAPIEKPGAKPAKEPAKPTA
jgi:peptidyl-prolyl cis-trans isomerase SurA